MAGNYVLLETIRLNQSAASVTFDNIPQSGYSDLKIVASMRDSGDDLVRFSLGFNSTSKTTTTRKILYADGTSVSSTTSSSNTSVGYGSTRSTGTANTFGNAEIYIPNYTSSNYKSFSVDATEENNHAANSLRSMTGGVWENTAAITSLSVICDAPNFAAGSTFSLYGVAAVGTTSAIAPKATGGNIVANDGTYWYHAFLSSGSFVPQTPLTADVLVVAGGGGGGSWTGGGGGAGGLLAFTSQSLTTVPYACTVGAGGAGGTYSAPSGLRGASSQFGSLTATTGGGGGAGYNGAYTYPLTGGSGGAGTSTNGAEGTGAAGNSGEGYAGGNGIGAPYYHGGGGGGSAQVGYPATGSPVAAGSGGNGLSTYSSWGLATSTGQNVSGTVYFAGGGGGGNNNGGNQGLGGYGGGGAGRVSYGQTPDSGTVNTGGGGGGGPSGSGSTAAQGGTGGSGIVIIRYPMV